MLQFLAGIEPVSNATSKALYFLSMFNDVQDKLYEEIVEEFSEEITYEKIAQAPYLGAFFNETLRLGNNIFLQTRTAACVSILLKCLIINSFFKIYYIFRMSN